MSNDTNSTSSAASCNNGHVFFYAGTPPIPDGFPCACGMTKYKASTTEVHIYSIEDLFAGDLSNKTLIVHSKKAKEYLENHPMYGEPIFATTNDPQASGVKWLECFEYDPDTGELKWKERPRHHFFSDGSFKRWNHMFQGRTAGTKDCRKNGARRCVILRVDGVGYYAHRVIWELHHGPVPEGMHIDHINGDPWDNRLCNLRPCSPSQNQHNRSLVSSGSAGLLGVTFRKDRIGTGRPWTSAIAMGGVRKYIGVYATQQEAHEAYMDMKKKHYGEYIRAEKGA